MLGGSKLTCCDRNHLDIEMERRPARNFGFLTLPITHVWRDDENRLGAYAESK